MILPKTDLIFLRNTRYNVDAQHVCTLTTIYTYANTRTYLKYYADNLKIYEVIIGVSLSARTPLTTENISC